MLRRLRLARRSRNELMGGSVEEGVWSVQMHRRGDGIPASSAFIRVRILVCIEESYPCFSVYLLGRTIEKKQMNSYNNLSSQRSLNTSHISLVT